MAADRKHEELPGTNASLQQNCPDVASFVLCSVERSTSSTMRSSAHVTAWVSPLPGTKRALKILRLCAVFTDLHKREDQQSQMQTRVSSDPESNRVPLSFHDSVLTQPRCSSLRYRCEWRVRRTGVIGCMRIRGGSRRARLYHVASSCSLESKACDRHTASCPFPAFRDPLERPTIWWNRDLRVCVVLVVMASTASCGRRMRLPARASCHQQPRLDASRGHHPRDEIDTRGG